MLAVLNVVEGPDKGRSLSFGRNQKLTIGRGTASSMCLTDPQVSRLHCEVAYDGTRVLVSDAGSGTGTWVNGSPVVAPQELQPGDIIVVGQTQLTFQWSDADHKSTEAWNPP